MIFSSVPFLVYFLPVVLLCYFAAPRRFKNAVLLLASLFFYGYGEPVYLLLLGAAILAAYVLGLLIPRHRWAFPLSVCISLGFLGWFKYADFFIESFGAVTGLPVSALGIALPVGISFYTFQILSYTIDVHRGTHPPQRNLLRFAMYVSLFPQLIAGPIVIYGAIEGQLDPLARRTTAQDLYEGARRFLIGLGKKVLIANQLGELVKLFLGQPAAEQTVLFHWMYGIAFSLQLYFDFSGYSDMAIGLGRLFGFTFPENFDYPFVSGTITEFWRRWHMTLGGWFREYVYIPLGGNRVSTARWILNIFIVWALTGLWHGAAWVFAVWGLTHGLFLLFEKLFFAKHLARMPSWVAHVYASVVLLFTMVLFNAHSLPAAVAQMGGLLGLTPAVRAAGFATPLTLYYLRSYGCLLILAMIGATPLPKRIVTALGRRIRALGSRPASEQAVDDGTLGLPWRILETLLLCGLFLVVLAYLVDGSYNPFLYFKF